MKKGQTKKIYRKKIFLFALSILILALFFLSLSSKLILLSSLQNIEEKIKNFNPSSIDDCSLMLQILNSTYVVCTLNNKGKAVLRNEYLNCTLENLLKRNCLIGTFNITFSPGNQRIKISCETDGYLEADYTFASGSTLFSNLCNIKEKDPRRKTEG